MDINYIQSKINKIIQDEDVRQDVFLYVLENNLDIETISISELKKRFEKNYKNYKERVFTDLSGPDDKTGSFVSNISFYRIKKKEKNQLLLKNRKEEKFHTRM